MHLFIRQITQETISKCGFERLDHPPYSPDIAPSDYFLFNHLKKHLRGRVFACVDDLKDCASVFLLSQNSQFFASAFDDLIVRWNKLITVQGSYIEK